MHAGQPILAERGRWADPRVAGDTGVTQGMNVRAIVVDPCVYLISSADGPVAGDEDIDVVRRALDQPPRGEAGLPTRVRQTISDSGRAAGRAVTGRRAEPGVPEQVIPMRMRREACHNGLAQLAKVVREAGDFVAVHPGVDEQHASPAVHDNGVALAELALVDQYTLRDLPQHGWLLPLVVCNRLSRP